MTVKEMHYDFDLKIDKVASFSKEDFNVAEKDWLLNEAQLVEVKTTYGTHNSYRKGFETTQKRYDDLSALHVKYPVQTGVTPTLHPEGVYEMSLSDLDFDYLFLTRAFVKADYKGCLKTINLRETQTDDLNLAMDDPFNNSSKEFILYNIGRGEDGTPSLFIYPDPNSTSIVEVCVEYLKYPAKINYGGYTYIDGVTYPTQDSELSKHLHPEIVDKAVEIASGIIEHPTYTSLRREKVFTNE